MTLAVHILHFCGLNILNSSWSMFRLCFFCLLNLDFFSVNLQKTLDMTKEEYESLPGWKQVNIKKAKGLFWGGVSGERGRCVMDGHSWFKPPRQRTRRKRRKRRRLRNRRGGKDPSAVCCCTLKQEHCECRWSLGDSVWTVLRPWRPEVASVSADVHSLDVSESFWCKHILALYLCKNPSLLRWILYMLDAVQPRRRCLLMELLRSLKRLKVWLWPERQTPGPRGCIVPCFFVYSFYTEVLVSFWRILIVN